MIGTLLGFSCIPRSICGTTVRTSRSSEPSLYNTSRIDGGHGYALHIYHSNLQRKHPSGQVFQNSFDIAYAATSQCFDVACLKMATEAPRHTLWPQTNICDGKASKHAQVMASDPGTKNACANTTFCNLECLECWLPSNCLSIEICRLELGKTSKVAVRKRKTQQPIPDFDHITMTRLVVEASSTAYKAPPVEHGLQSTANRARFTEHGFQSTTS